MDEEIQTIRSDKLKPYHAMTAMGDAFPAIGIVAAVLGVVKAMGALDQSPEILGGLIGAALVGTFLGIFMSYCVVGPIATKIKVVREKNNRPLHHRQADASCLHERFAAAGCHRVWPQDDFGLRPSFHRCSRAKHAECSFARKEGGMSVNSYQAVSVDG
jgi:hypothetical protein